MASIAYHSMDNATFLSFMHTIIERGQDEATMREKMGQCYTDFNGAYMQYDLAFNPARRSLESEDLVVLDGSNANHIGTILFVKGGSTAVENVKASVSQNDGKVYNIQGQYVGTSLDNQPAGLYIVNGKKIKK